MYVPKYIKLILPLGVGLLLIWYSLSSISEEERGLLWQQISNANLFWLILSVFLGILAHFSRAYRWQFLVKPLGYKVKISTSFMAVMMGYLANLGVPRSGELLRAATLSNYEDIPFQKTIGTIITERVIDLVMLLLVVFLAFILNTDILLNYLKIQNISILALVYTLVIGLLLSFVGFWVVQKLNIPFIKKVRFFILEIYEGMLSVFKMQNKIAFLAHTFVIWTLYILMFYVVKFSIPQVESLSFSAIIIAFVAGSFAMTATNGGVGVFPISIGLVLILFEVDKLSGEAYGWVLWSSQTLLNIVFGGLSFLLLPFFSRKK